MTITETWKKQGQAGHSELFSCPSSDVAEHLWSQRSTSGASCEVQLFLRQGTARCSTACSPLQPQSLLHPKPLCLPIKNHVPAGRSLGLDPGVSTWDPHPHQGWPLENPAVSSWVLPLLSFSFFPPWSFSAPWECGEICGSTEDVQICYTGSGMESKHEKDTYTWHFKGKWALLRGWP